MRKKEIQISKDVLSLEKEIITLRRHFHRYPEIGLKEIKTARFIADYLKDLGIEVEENVAGTGVVGIIRGKKPGKTALYRADMDALEVEEENTFEYKSRHKGLAHMCGHDAHMAIALGLTRLFSSKRDTLPGNIKFVFQPSEEIVPGGAKAMIAKGVLQNPRVDAAFGLHVWQHLPVGKVVIKPGPLFASIDVITLKVKGLGGHGAAPHYTVDPVLITAHIITSLEALITREINPTHSAVLTFGQVHAGTAANIIPKDSLIQGTFRCYNPDIRKLAVKRIKEMSRGIAAAFGGSCEVEIFHGQPQVYNNPEITSIVRRVAEKVLPKKNIVDDYTTMGAEDVACFLNRVPGCFFLLGTANVEKGITGAHHSPQFDIDEKALPIGVEIVKRAILYFLEGK